MKAKKVLKIIGIILLILIVLFLIHSIRNFIIINKLQDKISEYVNSNNYYIHMVSAPDDNVTITTDFYTKDNKQALFLERNNNGEITKLSFYYNGERRDMFIETTTEKTAIIDTEPLYPEVVVVNPLQTDNNWQTFLYGSISLIRSIEYDGKDCYAIENYLSPYYLYNYDGSPMYIIDKATGLLMKDGNSNMLIERKYEFNNVDDSIFIEPDISQYTIQK